MRNQPTARATVHQVVPRFHTEKLCVGLPESCNSFSTQKAANARATRIIVHETLERQD